MRSAPSRGRVGVRVRVRVRVGVRVRVRVRVTVRVAVRVRVRVGELAQRLADEGERGEAKNYLEGDLEGLGDVGRYGEMWRRWTALVRARARVLDLEGHAKGSGERPALVAPEWTRGACLGLGLAVGVGVGGGGG